MANNELQNAAVAANESLRLMLSDIYKYEGGSEFTCKYCGAVSRLDPGMSSFRAIHGNDCKAGHAIRNLNRLNEALKP